MEKKKNKGGVVEGEEWEKVLKEVKVKPEEMKRLVMNYLVVEGFSDAASLFSADASIPLPEFLFSFFSFFFFSFLLSFFFFSFFSFFSFFFFYCFFFMFFSFIVFSFIIFLILLVSFLANTSILLFFFFFF